jgi:hypothetical protein
VHVVGLFCLKHQPFVIFLKKFSYFSQNRLLPMKKGNNRNFFKTFSSFGHPGVSLNNNDLVNDKLLIDCGEDQDCVLGKFYVYNLYSNTTA